MSINGQMKVCFFVIMVSFLIVSCTPLFISEQATPTADFLDLEIIMEKGMCFGSCPAYKLQILGSGKGIYQGEYFVVVKGEQTFQVSNEQIQELLAAFEKADFYSLDDKYAVIMREQAFFKISISYRGKTKTVMHYGDC